MKNYELKDEIFNQKPANQPSMCKGKIDLDGELIYTIMFFKNFDTFENYLGYIDEHYDERSVINTEAEIFIET